LLVGIDVFLAVFLANQPSLFQVACHECSDLRIAGMIDARHHRFLCDVANTDNGVADFLFGRQAYR
jgi:hypothetical protein